ncbi:DUF2796 domain-containing protein [Vibrio sp. T187]|uniref:zinc uptake protein ZrgA n=1 Tax=Vibrio TaxID=662 RepID=UPI0010C97C96|nr:MULTISPECIES: DUF2796 domain-containing protein [Vibrio]MBW3697442.1 DUF2796 domain-containing protein [Vibrio sp. T187]
MKHSSIAMLVSLALSAPVIAEDSYRSHDAHVHGHVEVNIAQDGNELLLEVTAPGSDVVGFEYAPKTEQEKTAIQQATTLLNQPEVMFQFASKAQCELTFKSVTNTLSKDDDHEGHDHSGEHKHDHDEHEHHDDREGHDHDEHEHHDDHEGHDHDKHEHHDDHKGHDHDEHKHHDDHEGHDHDEHEHSGHGEFTVEYHYNCSSIEDLNSVDTEWFAKFTDTESITVNLLTDKVQTQQKLTAENSGFRF